MGRGLQGAGDPSCHHVGVWLGSHLQMVLGDFCGCRRFLGGSTWAPLPWRSGCIIFFSTVIWDTANGKLFPIPSIAQMAREAKQEGIKRPFLPLCIAGRGEEV